MKKNLSLGRDQVWEPERIIKLLRKAIEKEDIKHLIYLYEEANKIDWEYVADDVFDAYDALVSKGNDILFEHNVFNHRTNYEE